MSTTAKKSTADKTSTTSKMSTTAKKSIASKRFTASKMSVDDELGSAEGGEVEWIGLPLSWTQPGHTKRPRDDTLEDNNTSGTAAYIVDSDGGNQPKRLKADTVDGHIERFINRLITRKFDELKKQTDKIAENFVANLDQMNKRLDRIENNSSDVVDEVESLRDTIDGNDSNWQKHKRYIHQELKDIQKVIAPLKDNVQRPRSCYDRGVYQRFQVLVANLDQDDHCNSARREDTISNIRG
ncbi:hypothetical protein VMCG_08030 [Cytospora schulzeri]|uniref:Uncharacterized protein n=1 Tax=Cytospora schulzeri TaxID=448051 RepID=A0A423VYC7_9PEZI|nr:hypothetical protein VMCG_08030 [Valsa malicola]